MCPCRPAARFTALMLAAAMVAACGDDAGSDLSRAPSSDVVHIVAAENFWGDIAAQVGGARTTVTSIISDPNVDPHLYESDPEDAAAVAEADLVVVNGLELDEAVARLIDSTSKAGRKELSVADVLGVSGNEANPHLWYDVPRVSEVARAIAAQLAAIDPDGKPTYDANLATFERELRPVLALLAQIKSAHERTPVAYTERVAEYLLDAAGLEVRTPSGFALAVEEGDEPNPADMQEMNELLERRRVEVLVYNSQATSTATDDARDRAEDAGIPVVAVTETLPEDEPHYQSWQLHQLEALRTALGG